jgi:hypothetical protein
MIFHRHLRTNSPCKSGRKKKQIHNGLLRAKGSITTINANCQQNLSCDFSTIESPIFSSSRLKPNLGRHTTNASGSVLYSIRKQANAGGMKQ